MRGETQPIIRIVDVLPAPFGPEETERLAGLDLEVDAGDRDEGTEPLRQRARGYHRRPPYASTLVVCADVTLGISRGLRDYGRITVNGAFSISPRPSRPRWVSDWLDDWPTMTAVVGVAGVLALLAIVLGWRGSDLPAQVFRAELFRKDGFVLWNSQWFGGHALLGYSVIAPAISAPIGPLALGALSGIASAFLFERILRFSFGSVAWLGSLWFALGTVINLIVGRTTYAFGVALGLGAIYALQHRKVVFAVIAAMLCALASPLAGGFLAIVALAWAAAERTRRVHALLVLAGALAPVAIIALLFPTAGSEPYEPWALIWDLCLCLVVAVALRRYPAARWGAACFALVAIGSYVVPSALGGNVSRLGQYVAGPLLACVLVPRRRLVLAALVDPAAHLAVVPGRRRHRVRTHRSVDARVLLRAARQLPRRRRARRSDGSRSRRRIATGRPRTWRRTLRLRVAGNANSTSRTTRSSTPSR